MPHTRLDILAVPWICRGAALLYYTVRYLDIYLGSKKLTSVIPSIREMILWVSPFFSNIKHIYRLQQFNRAIRFKANRMGYSLNQRGLYTNVIRDTNDRRRKLTPGERNHASTDPRGIVITHVLTFGKVPSSPPKRKKIYFAYLVGFSTGQRRGTRNKSAPIIRRPMARATPTC